ncbi:glycosyltransferase [Agrobacterium rosae]|uniref:Glycosyltransferase n=1 Tax=Agrobacterium rosae TaxID=1972867 RepID=A0AAW9FK04_9HYPH|nr:glycosyltransferase [Agrobacterium rosae]MDX8306066.1 glycosyltransferase [Agrobacterium rosae]
MANATVWDIGKVPRLHLPVPNIKIRRSQSHTAKFIATHYKLAKALPVVVPSSHTWLSVVVPVYNAPERYLEDLTRSFENQGLPGTELIFSDDASTSLETDAWYRNRSFGPNVHILRNQVNGGIARATNAGLAKAHGTWIAFLDHDDLVAPHAFKMISKTLSDNPEAKFIYTDELVVDERLKPLGLMLKPAYDPVLLTGVNYINHLSVYRRDRLEELGFLKPNFDGSQDYDLLLRYLEGIPTEDVLHLPYPAYWWRRSDQSYSQRFLDKATTAARVAIKERFGREGKTVHVSAALTKSLHRVEFNLEEQQWPKISIIIPSKDSFELVRVILDGIYGKTDYPNFEVIIVDNGSSDHRVISLYENYRREHLNFSAHIGQEKFNFSRSVNRGISLASGDHYLILNNDIEIIDDSWLKEMVSCLQFESTGIVGAKLLYPNGSIQHAGVIVGLGGLAGHWYLNKPSDFGGPMNRLHLRNSVTCVTGAAMLISGECAASIGDWDETNFAVAYNDVDYCLRAHMSGIRCVWTPFSLMYHNESASRGSDAVGESKIRFDIEKENLRRIYNTGAFDDRTTNPGYGKWHSVPHIVPPSHLPKAR